MSAVSSLTINPKYLKWAREESGFSVNEVANRLEIDENQYLSWEENGTDISFAHIKKLSDLYKLQIAAFFLPFTPKKHKKPSDFRNIDLRGENLSTITYLAIRRTNKFRDLLLELNGYEYYEKKYKWLFDELLRIHQHDISDEIFIELVRQKLGYSISEQVNDKSYESSYLNWRNCIENIFGIHIFQFSLPESEVQGFCYSDDYPYCIVVNSKYSTSSKIFTLFHELCHIFKRQSGLCIPDKVNNENTNELECNDFAGKLLLPNDYVFPALDKDDVFDLAKHFKVSSEVYLRRLKSIEMLTDDEFFSLLEQIRSSVKTNKKFGIATPLQKSINSRGQLLFDTVVKAVKNNIISYERAADVLDLKINYILDF